MVAHIQAQDWAAWSGYSLQIATYVGDPSAYQAYSPIVAANLALTKIYAL